MTVLQVFVRIGKKIKMHDYKERKFEKACRNCKNIRDESVAYGEGCWICAEALMDSVLGWGLIVNPDVGICDDWKGNENEE